jgi:ParB-like chromosome segregation protein Spo0J
VRTLGKLWIWISNELIEIEIEIKIKDEYAKLIPELSEGEYNELKQSIKENGLWSPIIINKKGYILDGHHRYRISRGLGISPSTTLKIFDDQLQEKLFVIDSNLTRRQLSEFARIEIALTKKRILEQMAKLNMSPGGKGVRIQTPLGRIAVTKIAIVP